MAGPTPEVGHAAVTRRHDLGGRKLPGAAPVGDELVDRAGDLDELADRHRGGPLLVKTKMPSEVAALPSPLGSWM